MKYGTVCAYWTKEWSNEDYKAFAKKIKGLGFDVMELPAGDLLKMSDEKLFELRDIATELNLEISSNIGPPKNKNISSENPEIQQAGIKYLQDIMLKMEKLGSKVLVGAMYNCWPYDFTDLDKPAIWKRAVANMRLLADFAEKHNITLCLEVLNRFETNLINTCSEGVKFCNEVGKDNVKLLLDTFHMNIEEDNLPRAIIEAGSHLGHLHVGEGNRKLPGQGHLPWAEIGIALRKIGYENDVVMEPFLKSEGEVGRDIKVWRDLSDNADAEKMDSMIADSLGFLKSNFEVAK